MARARGVHRERPLPPRPRTRSECVDGPRPCPWWGCKHNCAAEITSRGSLQLTGDEGSCALDLAAEGARTLEAVAELLNLTKERVRQTEAEALAKVRAELEAQAYTLADLAPPAPPQPEGAWPAVEHGLVDKDDLRRMRLALIKAGWHRLTRFGDVRARRVRRWVESPAVATLGG